MADYVSLTDQRRMRITVPPINVQRGLGRTLGTLDDKIDLNREMNRTLEAMAQTIFRSWFVDFDPVVAKSEGREPFGMDADTAALFPDRFVESELGPIPEGWEVGPVYSMADVVYGAPFKSALFNEQGEGRPVVRIRDLPSNRPSVHTTEIHPKESVIRPGDVVVGMDGNFSAYWWGGPDSLMNQRVCCFKPRAPHMAVDLRFHLQRPLAFLTGAQVGTTVIHLGKRDIDRFRVVIPPKGLVSAFSLATASMLDLILANLRESQTIAALRDLLLPKLLSGEIRVPEAAEMVEDVV